MELPENNKRNKRKNCNELLSFLRNNFKRYMRKNSSKKLTMGTKENALKITDEIIGKIPGNKPKGETLLKKILEYIREKFKKKIRINLGSKF